MKQIVVLLSMVLIQFAFTYKSELPEPWFEAGYPDNYSVGIDSEIYHTAPRSVFIVSDKKRSRGFGCIMQTSSAKDYLGKKIKLSGYLKSEKVKGWAGFWLRVDDEKSGKSVSFDNMKDRSIKGTTDWTRYEIVLYVPKNSSTLNYGALLSGAGKIWFDSVVIEEVPMDTKSTSNSTIYEKPENLGFDK